jgi:hypothetical protein
VSEETIRVTGVAELARAFRKVDSDLPKKLKARFLDIAESVASVARDKMPSRTGAAQASLKARSSPRGGAIAFGGTAAPYEPWLDFGGRVGRGRSIERERVPGGRYLYPALAEKRNDTIDAVNLAIKEVAEGAGFDTRESF